MANHDRNQGGTASDSGELSALGHHQSRRGRRLGSTERGFSSSAHSLDERAATAGPDCDCGRSSERRHGSGVRECGGDVASSGREHVRAGEQFRQGLAHLAAEASIALPHRLPGSSDEQGKEREDGC